MKIINIMNFVRKIDERMENSEEILFRATEAELALVNEFQVENTFLLQYDALCDERYIRLFKEHATTHTELGIWYEIVEPLASACGIPYRSQYGWKWDWHIVPGFSMSYTQEQREALIEETMRKFKEVFGYYPKTVASWLLDTHTLNYLAENYDIHAAAICRDQTNTDAYTLIGGYFNGAYYPSRNNIFTPAQTKAMRTDIPVFRLLGPCPIHNYDGYKYLPETRKHMPPCCTLEAVWYTGYTPECVDWFYKTFYENESLSLAYAQIGQENSFGEHDLVTPLRMQIEKILKYPDVAVMKMCDAGDIFRKEFPMETPASAVCALDDWAGEDTASVYYQSSNYVCNLFRYQTKIFFRALYLFDENVREHYLSETCNTFDAVYENLPVMDSLRWHPTEKKACGWMIDTDGAPFRTEKDSDGNLCVSWKEHCVIFEKDRIRIRAERLCFHKGDHHPDIAVSAQRLDFCYKDIEYAVCLENGTFGQSEDGTCIITDIQGEAVLYFIRKTS